jgi:hypothetical protein
VVECRLAGETACPTILIGDCERKIQKLRSRPSFRKMRSFFAVPANQTPAAAVSKAAGFRHFVKQAASWSDRIGFVRKSFIPTAKQWSRSVAVAEAVSATIGTLEPELVNLRIAKVAAKPSIPGMTQSMNTSSYSLPLTFATASSPSFAVSTWQPNLASKAQASL